MEDLRIVLLGKTGSGKSSTGNTMVGTSAFEVGSFSESKTDLCGKHTVTLDDRNISVIDTPGLFHTSMAEEDLKVEMEKCLEMSAPGPHVFLLVIRLGRFTDEERNTIKWIQENFGKEVMRFTIVLFTGVDNLKKPFEEFLEKNIKLKEVLDKCRDYYLLTNVEKNDRAQVFELMKKMQTIVMMNRREHYTEKMYLEAQRKIREEEEMKIQEEVKKREEINFHDKIMKQILCGGIAIGLSGFLLYRYGANVLRCKCLTTNYGFCE